MSQEKKNEAVAENPATVSSPAPETAPAPQQKKSKPAPVKESAALILTGAASYSDLNLKLGPFHKGRPFKVDADDAETLLKTRLFERA